ncbi:MAG: hypothetical protein AB1489_38530 [Acidobacteriota bacterium]
MAQITDLQNKTLDIGLGQNLPVETNYTESGDKELLLAKLLPGSRVTTATLRVQGDAFQGFLNYFNGIKATASPTIYDASGKPTTPSATNKAFIIDFTGIRSILTLDLRSNTETIDAKITMVLPWFGNDFAAKALYPVTDPISPGQYAAKPDATGISLVRLTGVETTKLFVQVKLNSGSLNEDSFAENLRITTATYPMNVKASLNGRLPFWTQPGVLNKDVEVTGLKEELTTLLKDGQNATAIKLLFTTDTPGVLLTSFDADKDLIVEQAARVQWGNDFSRQIDLQTLKSEIVPISAPAATADAWLIKQLDLELAGEFPNWRAYKDQASDIAGKFAVKVNSQFNVARRFVFSETGELFGFSLLVRLLQDKTVLRCEITNEKEFQPDTAKPLAIVEVEQSPNNSEEYLWIEALLPAPIEIPAQNGFWLIVKTKSGAMEWTGVPVATVSPWATLFTNEGSRWQRYPSVQDKYPLTQIRILRRPFTKEVAPLLNIDWPINGKSLSRSVDISTNSSKIELIPDQSPIIVPSGGSASFSLKVQSQASGRLTIKSAALFYQIAEGIA